ncbi:hypothetical protein NKI19_25810 [Mesorhizobium sp. M0751]|uniref:hypothetical protein n=1 Tax=unclassified Mesorhizobium TaxID=325217 RepID=UPI00333AE0D1
MNLPVVLQLCFSSNFSKSIYAFDADASGLPVPSLEPARADPVIGDPTAGVDQVSSIRTAGWFRLQRSAFGCDSNYLRQPRNQPSIHALGRKKAFMAGRGVSAT